MDLKRREVLASAAGISALGLTGSLSFMPAALAADIRGKGFYSWKVGDIEVISIYDGIWKVDPKIGFVKNASVDEVKAALTAADLDSSFIPVEFAFTIVKSGGKTILVDSGTGGQLSPDAKQGRLSMEAAGVKPEDIDMVLISHFHPDHIFGLIEMGTTNPVYPNAEIKVGETEYKFWTNPETIGNTPEARKGIVQRINASFPVWKNVSQYNGDEELVSGIRSVDSFGHSPGHTCFHLSSGDDQAMLLGDVLNLPALFLANLDWQLSFDQDPDAASATRRAIVERAVAENMTIAGYHFGFPNSGKFEKDGAGYVFVPTSV